MIYARQWLVCLIVKIFIVLIVVCISEINIHTNVTLLNNELFHEFFLYSKQNYSTFANTETNSN